MVFIRQLKSTIQMLLSTGETFCPFTQIERWLDLNLNFGKVPLTIAHVSWSTVKFLMIIMKNKKMFAIRD